ncbi:MAG: serine/threonine-protein kinase, partial [Pyrinomonadaceae bacterium]
MLRPNDQIGPYTLIRPLGAGSFGEVWLAEKRGKLATVQVAIKFPRLVIEEDETDSAASQEKQRRAIATEAEIWTKASGHTNVLPIIEADVIEGHLVIVSEYASGGSLGKWLAANGGKAPSEVAAVEMMSGILRGLEHLHRRGIIHRDLKPGNILLQEGNPRLTDFGISRLLDADPTSSFVSGTYAYMSPEALDGIRSEQTDVWSAGVIFYRMLAGHLPFTETEPKVLIESIQTSDFAPLPETVSPLLKEVVNKALEKNPENRFASAAAMKNALLAFFTRADSPVKPLDHEDLPTIEALGDFNRRPQEAAKLQEQQNEEQNEEVQNEEQQNEGSSNEGQIWGSGLKSVGLFLGVMIVLLPVLIIIGERWYPSSPEPLVSNKLNNSNKVNLNANRPVNLNTNQNSNINGNFNYNINFNSISSSDGASNLNLKFS